MFLEVLGSYELSRHNTIIGKERKPLLMCTVWRNRRLYFVTYRISICNYLFVSLNIHMSLFPDVINLVCT